MRTVFAVVLVVVFAVVTACGGGEVGRPAYEWGQMHPGPQVDITAQEPESFTTSSTSSMKDEAAWRSTVVVRNRSNRPFSLGWMRIDARADGEPQNEVVDPRNGCNGLIASPPVLPGETQGFPSCWTGSGDQWLVLTGIEGWDTATFAD